MGLSRIMVIKSLNTKLHKAYLGVSRIMVIKSLNMKLHKPYLRGYLGKHLEAYPSYKILKSYLGGYIVFT
jgi:hypothetical protein